MLPLLQTNSSLDNIWFYSGFAQIDDKHSAIALLLVYFLIWMRRHVIEDTKYSPFFGFLRSKKYGKKYDHLNIKDVKI